jgi:hypothetical protein
MAAMRAVQVAAPNGPFSLVERPLPDPGPGEVRIFSGLKYPIEPGHEIAGADFRCNRIPSF